MSPVRNANHRRLPTSISAENSQSRFRVTKVSDTFLNSRWSTERFADVSWRPGVLRVSRPVPSKSIPADWFLRIARIGVRAVRRGVGMLRRLVILTWFRRALALDFRNAGLAPDNISQCDLLCPL